MQRRKIVILSGAGISAESGLQTFRGIDGLWEGHRIEDVASPEGFLRDPETVLRFYNIRRAACRKAQPNAGHKALVELEKFHDVHIITQNIDDLHERAGSTNVLHLHGEILKSESTVVCNNIYTIDSDELNLGDLCADGFQLRPHVVWFGEAVPNMTIANKLVKDADVFIVIGTSLQVYPAAGLVHEIKNSCELYIIDPNASEMRINFKANVIAENATVAIPLLVNILAY